MIEGEIEIAGQVLKAGDAYLFDASATVKSNQDAQMIWFDLPE